MGPHPTDLHPGAHAARRPDHPAVVDAATGATTTFAELEGRSRALAAALAARGLGPGDEVALLVGNEPATLEAAWAAQRLGLHHTPVNWHLTPEEVRYVVTDCGARVVLASSALRDLAEEALAGLPPGRVLVDGAAPGWDSGPELVATAPAPPPDRVDVVEGQAVYYSSGTTGRPKGIVRPGLDVPYGAGTPLDVLLGGRYGFDADTVYLSPAPLYHAAPLAWSMGTQRRGGTVVVMERFDAAALLDAVARHRVTHLQVVPTMFVRLLALPEEVRAAADLSSLRVVVHAAAPCPVPVKEQMLDWWGPIIHEFYGGSEGVGFVAIGPEEWRERKGSVGRSQRGPIHVCDPDGRELGPGETGVVWFEGAPPFAYRGAPEKTAAAFDERGWATLGDVGHVDADGYLYLTDRATDMIISGGVNVYPQEVEQVLLLHPDVVDAGVVGEPHADLGEVVVAYVEAGDDADRDGLPAALEAHVQQHLARFKRPRCIEVLDELPRLATGKLLRRRLRQRAAGRDGAR